MKNFYFHTYLITSFYLLLKTSILSGGIPSDINRQLSVFRTNIINKDGNSTQMRGVIPHSSQRYRPCVNFNSANVMVNDWGIEVLRMVTKWDTSMASGDWHFPRMSLKHELNINIGYFPGEKGCGSSEIYSNNYSQKR